MARKIAVVCVWLGLLSPAGANALGLGDIHVRSALNQPLDAEVELISATSVELEDLEISLAPRETFERYGLDRPAFLSGLRFDVTRSTSGEPMLHVTTSNPVSEPFLTFLIEAEWPRGRLLREYTVLLDPPVYLSDEGARAPVREESISRSEPDASVAGPITRRSERDAPRAHSPSPGLRSGEYGPVERNETLWTIADRLRAGSDVSVNQMMIALYRANPEAFGGNINLLLAGAVLRVPDGSTIDALATGEADSEVARQNSLWQEDSGTLTAGASDAEPAGGRLRLVPPSDEAIAEAGGSAAGGTVDESAASAADGDDDALRREVAELQSRLEEAERLVELKDSELAALQGRLAELERAGADEAAPTGQASPGVDLETDTAGEPTTTEEVAVAEEAAAPAQATAAAAPPRATINDSGGFGDTLASIFGSMWLYVGLGIALLLGAMLIFAQRRRAPAEITGRWQSFDESEDEPAPPRTSATQTLRALPDAGESIVVVEQKPARREAPAAARAKAREKRPEPAAADDDDTLSSPTAVHLDQADPLAEADFHMAYGLYDQAADLVRKASKEEPDRRDLRMKLLEIYFVWGNEQAFLEEAQQLYDSTGGRPDADWDKILIMGKQICPDEALFAGEPGAPSAESAAVDLELAGDETGDSTVDFVTEGGGEDALDLDLGDATQEDPQLAQTGRTRAHGGDADMLDFDFDEEPLDELDVTREEGSTIEASGFESPTVETPTLEQPGPESPTVESPTLESARYEDSTVETPTIEQRISAVRGAGGSDQTAEIDLYDLGLDLENLRDDDSLEGTLGDAEATMLADLSGFDERREAGQPDSDEFDASLTTPAGTAGRSAFDETSELGETAGRRDFDATSELAVPDADALDIDLEDLSAALESSDTVEQPRPAAGGDTVRQRRATSDDTQQITAAGEEFLDMDLTEMLGDDAHPVGSAGATDFNLDDLDETESEVGTKLDLARAYMDMGDPEGANSILQEVLEEGDSSQRDEAQRLLNALP
ncbi:MAG: FimV/HubP family polar landmark protein [Gammaproteobacteria bacterium]